MNIKLETICGTCNILTSNIVFVFFANNNRFHEIPYSLKDKEYPKYKRYLKNVAEYLKDFFQRTQPLTDFSVIEAQNRNYELTKFIYTF